MIFQTCNINKDKWYAEWCPNEYSRSGCMIPISRVERIQGSSLNTGYSTNYVFSKEDAFKIRSNGNSRGLDKYKVGAWDIVIDLDKGEEQFLQVRTKLIELELEFYVYFSGGKGYHIYLPQTEFIYSKHLPYSQELVVKSILGDYDPSLYQHGRLLSMIGRVHPKTGVKKHFVEHVEGIKVKVMIVEKPEFTYSRSEFTSNISSVMIQVANLSENEPGVGGRHTGIWSVSMNLFDLGLAYETVLDLMLTVNNKWVDSKTDIEVTKAVQQARRQSNGKAVHG